MLTLNDIHRSVEALSPSSPVEISKAAAPRLPLIAIGEPGVKPHLIGLDPAWC
ncbi:hypothetical protein [Hoeflea alexandrii]|uniref:hypothetical protein n=1 Tax=Hoeflea alexandrii TaxID=288436 RepID=UPI00226FC6F7|nr:hypothetical protein [Hoeflea alexandrii]MCY0154986.1 hypothetical protein [Hoeflea alexandrii]